jgi:hypothetical protein
MQVVDECFEKLRVELRRGLDGNCGRRRHSLHNAKCQHNKEAQNSVTDHVGIVRVVQAGIVELVNHGAGRASTRTGA